MKLFLVRQLNNTLKVAYESDYEKLKKIKVGEFYECEIKQPRNIMFHRKFFALINLVFQNQEHFNNIDILRSELIINAGFYEVYHELETGEQRKKAKSIRFAKMKEYEFNELYNRVIDVIVKNFNFGKQEIIDNIEQFF